MQYYPGLLESLVIIERKRLERLVEEYGLLHPVVLKQSQKLDHAIVEIQRRELVYMNSLHNAV